MAWLGFAAALALLGLASLGTAGAAQAQPPEQTGPDDLPSAFLDPAAQTLVEGARAAQDSARLALASYTARVHERQQWQLVGHRSTHMLQECRQSLRYRWSRDDARVVRLDKHWALHSALAGQHGCENGILNAENRGLDPWRNPLDYAVAMLPDAYDPRHGDPRKKQFASPLDPGAERLYRYRSGDTVSVVLPGGEAVRAVSVAALPRTREVGVLAAVMWIDAESFGLVRIAFRPAKRIDEELVWCLACEGGRGPGVFVDLGSTAPGDEEARAAAAPDSAEGGASVWRRLVNAAFSSALPKMEIGVASVVADYALWDSRHWLPRSITWLGFASPVDELVANEDLQDFSFSGRVSSQVVFEIEEIREAGSGAETAAQVARRWTRPGDHVDEAGRADPSQKWIVWPPDSTAASAEPFGDGIWDDVSLAGGGEAGRMASELAALETDADVGVASESGRWLFEPPLLTLRLLGYNRQEGFTVGTRLWRRFRAGRAVASVRMGTVLREPQGALAVEREFPDWKLRVSVFRDQRPVGLVAEDSAAGAEPEREWNAVDGITLRLSSARRNRESLALRLFAERHSELGPGMREGRAGAEATWAPWWGGAKQRGLQGGGEVSLQGALGDERTVRAAGAVALVVGRGAGWSLGLEGGGARTWGGGRRVDPWLLDRSGDVLRGHVVARRHAAVVWRGRADVQRRVWLGRVSLFGDWLSASGTQYRSAGAGVVLPGGVRFDVAKGFPADLGGGLRTDSGWQFYMRVDAYL